MFGRVGCFRSNIQGILKLKLWLKTSLFQYYRKQKFISITKSTELNKFYFLPRIC